MKRFNTNMKTLNKRTICITTLEKELQNHLESIVGSFLYFPNISKNDLKEKIKENNIDVIFTNPNQQDFKIDKNLLEHSKISVICTASTGLNHIDSDYCASRNIKIFSITKDMETIEKISSTAEHAFGLMLSLIRKIPASFNSVKKGLWTWEPFVGRQINFLSIGIVGYGRLGKMMKRYCEAFGAKVFVCDPYVECENNVSIETLFKTCDVISLHVHVTNETRHMINHNLIKNIKIPLYLINTSRGEIVNENDVISGIESGKILGYATDVVEDEFGNLDNSPLLKRNDLNIIVTPHIAGMTKEARIIAYKSAMNKLLDV